MSDPKRGFGFDTSSISTTVPLLPTGFYAGEITGASIEGRGGKQFVKVNAERKWNKNLKEMELTGDFEVSGMFMYSAILNSKKAIHLLQRDDPRIFGGMFFLRYNKAGENGFALNPTSNVPFGDLLKVCGLSDTDFTEMIDWEYDEEIEVPEEFADVEDIVLMLNAAEYSKAILTVVCQSINGMQVKVNVIKRPTRDNPNVQENTINVTSNSCGLLPYVDGCEEDLEEED